LAFPSMDILIRASKFLWINLSGFITDFSKCIQTSLLDEYHPCLYCLCGKELFIYIWIWLKLLCQALRSRLIQRNLEAKSSQYLHKYPDLIQLLYNQGKLCSYLSELNLLISCLSSVGWFSSNSEFYIIPVSTASVERSFSYIYEFD
jgi:hypothetical protein